MVTIDSKIDNDFDDLLENINIINNETTKIHKETLESIGVFGKEKVFYSKSRKLKKNVFDWLLDNVADDKHGKSWCVGNDEYNSNQHYNKTFTIFFKRKTDAFKFVKNWSMYKKFTTQINYFSDTRKELDLKTNKYIHSER